MTLQDELQNAQSQLNIVTFEVSTGTWSGPNITGAAVLAGYYQADCSYGSDQINAAANIYFTAMPGIPINAPIQVFAGYNGQAAAIFKGEVSGKAWEFAPGKFVLPCRDRLARTRFGWAGADREYTLQNDDVVIRNVLEAYGLPSTIAEIAGSTWQLGIIQPVVLKTSATGYGLISEIDSLTPYRTYTDGLGVIRRKSIFTNIITPTYDFIEGINIIRISRQQDPLWPNQSTVNGLTYEDVAVTGVATATNDNIPSPPGLLADETQSDLIETDAQAALAAQYLLTIKRAESERFELDTIGNPLIQPLDLIHLQCASAGIVLDSIVESVRHTITASSFLTTIRTLGILNADEATNGFDPIARATAIIDKEAVYIGGVLVERYFVALDGSTSTDTDGAIVSYAWSVSGGTPSSGTGVRFVTMLTSLAGATATLTVTDEQGLTDGATISLDPGNQAVKTRQLAIAAAAGGLVYLADGTTTPLVFTRVGQSCVCVPSIFAGRPLGGWGDGVLTRVNPDLATLQTLHTFGAAIRAIWVNEGDPTQVLVGAGGELWRSLDSGATWTLLHTFADTINDCQSSPTAPNDIRVCSGAALWQASDAATFAAVVTGPSGATAMMLATAPWGNTVVFAGAGTAIGTIAFEGAPTTVAWSAITSPPTSLQSITPNLTQRGYIAGDGTGRLFAINPTAVGYAAANILTLGSGNQASDLQRDGSMDGLVYAAAHGGTGSAAYKLINKATAYQIYQGDVLQIGYGDLVALTGVFGVIWPTWDTSPTGLHILSAGVWSLAAFPQAGAFDIYGIAANSAGDQLLVTLSNDYAARYQLQDVNGASRIVIAGTTISPLWHYNLLTKVWTEISLPSPLAGPAVWPGGIWGVYVRPPEWFPNSNRWYLTVGADSEYDYTVTWIRGTGTAAGPVTVEPQTDNSWSGTTTAGQDADIVGVSFFVKNAETYRMRYVPDGGSAAIPVGTALPGGTADLDGGIDGLPGGRKLAFLLSNNDLYYSADYRATAPTLVSGGLGSSMTATAHDVYIGGRSGVYKVSAIDGTPSGAVVAATGLAVGVVRADRQTRQTVVGIVGANLIGTLDGAAWDTITGPGASASNLAPVIEVLRP